MKLKSDPRTNTEEQINTQHIEFTFCNLHYVKCNKLWNVYAGCFHCFCWIGFRRQKICTRTKIRGNICSRLHLLTKQRFFSFFLLQDEKKCYRQQDTLDECIYIVKRIPMIYIYIYIKVIRRCVVVGWLRILGQVMEWQYGV